jgi:hypothetical protein
VVKPSWSAASDPWSRRDVHRLGRRFGGADRQTGRDVGARTTARRLPWRNGLVVMKWQPVGGLRS